jgi:hypothetical protein
MSLGLYGKI